MIYTIEELRHEILDKAEDVYGIFKDFFGEGFVDLQIDGRTLHNEDLLPLDPLVSNHVVSPWMI